MGPDIKTWPRKITGNLVPSLWLWLVSLGRSCKSERPAVDSVSNCLYFYNIITISSYFDANPYADGFGQ